IGYADSDEFAAEPLLCRLALEHDRVGSDAERPAVRHGIAGIDCEVEQGELELARVDLDGTALVGNRDLDGDIVAERAAEHILELGKPPAEIDDSGGEHLSAREREQLTGETFAAIGRVRDHVEKTRVLFRRQIAPQPLHAAAHDHQEIVEVVGDAAGQLSDRLQTLGLPQRGLRSLTALGFGVEPPRAPQRHPMMSKRNNVAGKPKTRWLAMVANHSPRIAELSMPAMT